MMTNAERIYRRNLAYVERNGLEADREDREAVIKAARDHQREMANKAMADFIAERGDRLTTVRAHDSHLLTRS